MQEVLAALASDEARSGLSHLAEKLARLRLSNVRPQAITCCRRRPRRPGWVLDAVVDVLTDVAVPTRPKQVHAAVEALLNDKVSENSVSWVLSSHSLGPSPLFVRVARGRYVLASTL